MYEKNTHAIKNKYLNYKKYPKKNLKTKKYQHQKDKTNYKQTLFFS